MEPEPGIIPSPSPEDTIIFHYNRIIDLQNHSLSNLPNGMSAQWTIPSMVYDSVNRRILVIERQSYASGFTDNNFAIDAFDIHLPLAPVRRYRLISPTMPLHSMSGGLSKGHFCISGNTSPISPDLLHGSIETTLYPCVIESESIPSHYHPGQIVDIIRQVNNNPPFSRMRIPPTSTGGLNSAFTVVTQSVSITKYTKEIICQP